MIESSDRVVDVDRGGGEGAVDVVLPALLVEAMVAEAAGPVGIAGAATGVEEAAMGVEAAAGPVGIDTLAPPGAGPPPSAQGAGVAETATGTGAAARISSLGAGKGARPCGNALGELPTLLPAAAAAAEAYLSDSLRVGRGAGFMLLPIGGGVFVAAGRRLLF